jgi:hypothetical protein
MQDGVFPGASLNSPEFSLLEVLNWRIQVRAGNRVNIESAFQVNDEGSINGISHRVKCTPRPPPNWTRQVPV